MAGWLGVEIWGLKLTSAIVEVEVELGNTDHRVKSTNYIIKNTEHRVQRTED